MESRAVIGRISSRAWERLVLPAASAAARGRLDRMKRSAHWPRVAVVKQDCNEDLYCCERGTPVLEMLQSTLLRSGPVALFTEFDAEFLILRTEPDPECQIWREKSDPLGWCPASWFEAFRDHVPGRDYGQAEYAVDADSVDWNEFDLVVSIDVAVPARITRKYPNVVWAYYVREIKAPSWQRSFETPIEGQDLYLSHRFEPFRRSSAGHVVDFPYHFQYCGIFHELAGMPWPETSPRRGVFVEYHTARAASDREIDALAEFGSVYAHRPTDDVHDAETGERIPARSMSAEGLRALTASKYHVKWGGRSVFGTAKVEAVAAGCLVLSDSARDGTRFLQSDATMAADFPALLELLRRLERDHEMYERQLARQRKLVDYLCCLRPANDLMVAVRDVRRRKRHA